jgi:quercetin 2,3-dioxygenase
MPNTEAIIYLSENRKCFQTDTFRNFETILNPGSETPQNSILKFSDNTLSAHNSQHILADNFVVIVLLPLVGAIEIFKENESKIIDSGEIAYISMKPNEEIFVQNPYENELVNYLEIWIQSESRFEENIFCKLFNLDNNRNKLIDISHENIADKILIGKFDGREEGVSSLINNQAFALVISGVFEVNNRLLESRTALSLWNINELEFEGLGRENIILIVT